MSFDWNNHVVIDGFDYLRDQDNLPLGYHTEQSISFLEKAGHLIEKTLDQIATIPEVQSLILDASENGTIRLLQAGNEERLSDPRLRVTLSLEGTNEYTPSNNTIRINVGEFASLQYNDPPVPFSIQRLLIHEIGHAADDRLNDPDLAHKYQIDAAESAVREIIDRFPNAAEEFSNSGTIEGLPFHKLLNSVTLEDFDSAYNEITGGNHYSSSRSFLDKEGAFEQRFDYLDPSEVIGAYFTASFSLNEKSIIAEREEIPIIDSTNQILSQYYGEPARQGYSSSINQNIPSINMFMSEDPDFDSVLTLLENRVHDDLKENTHQGFDASPPVFNHSFQP